MRASPSSSPSPWWRRAWPSPTPVSPLGIRWVSAKVGEGLIFDMRSQVFSHIQRMPLAFFTRTQTGALISRLNNDVIGAQQAFTDTLSSIVSNFISVVLVLAVMFFLSWQITLISLIILPDLRVTGQAGGAEALDHHPRVLRPQRPDEQHHERALQRVRCPSGEAVRSPQRGARLLREESGQGPRHRGDPGHVRPLLHRRPDPHRRAGHRRGLRMGRGTGSRRGPHRRHRGGAGLLPHPPLCPPDRSCPTFRST